MNTKKKLDEAGFFLSHLSDSQGKNPDFDFYLNAFISAARSVTWIMKAEYGKVLGWQEWFDSRKPNVEEKSLLSSFTRLRNKSQKAEPLETKAVIVMDFAAECLTPEFTALIEGGVGKRFQLKLFAIPEDGEMGGIPKDAIYGNTVSAERRMEELGEQNVLGACEKYFAALTKLVEQCEANFAV